MAHRDQGLIRLSNLLGEVENLLVKILDTRDQGIRIKGPYQPEVVQLGNGISEKDLLMHDERAPMAYHAMLAEMQPPKFPMPVGVIRRVEAPVFDAKDVESRDRCESRDRQAAMKAARPMLKANWSTWPRYWWPMQWKVTLRSGQ